MDVSCRTVGDEPSVFIAHEPEGYPGLNEISVAVIGDQGAQRLTGRQVVGHNWFGWYDVSNPRMGIARGSLVSTSRVVLRCA